MSLPIPAGVTSPADLLNLLYDTIWQMRMTNYSSVAALTIITYDVISTLPREIEHIWKSRWTFPKVLYLCARYYGIMHVAVVVIVTTRLHMPISASMPTLPVVVHNYRGGPIVFATIINIIMLLRVHALYHHNFKVLCILIFALLGEFSAELFISIKYAILLTRSLFTPPLGLPLTGCLAVPNTGLTLVAWVPGLVVAAFFFAMTLWKFIDTARKSQKAPIWKVREWKTLSPFLVAFIKDGTIFFFLITLTLLVSTILTMAAPNAMKTIPLSWLIAVYSFAGCRLILNLREVGRGAGPATRSDATSQTAVERDIHVYRPYA
ncbi:hypothetical protein BDQ12DRAFT_729437 [Crucibulum laeve]|uniref:DUF6533 domain-containing protein n=1 Tax=Crucibulum laeve TaxID=68775 RepID=A0A5C3LEL2_9AGAR|nr:hypothetical protein BDQ12DRAFT_729437 [Crucibulum laeve]